MRIIVAIFLSIFILANVLFILNDAGNIRISVAEKVLKSKYAIEYLDLIKKQKHFNPGSPEGIRTAERINKIERRVEGYAKAEKPDEFARILYEMKIASGEDVPSYPLNYKLNELTKAVTAKNLFKKNIEKLDWIERGPGNVSGRARGLIIDPGDPTGNTWFVGSVGGGIWKTTNGGNSWRDLAPALPNLAVSTIVMSKSNQNILYAGTGESMMSVDVINGEGILKSTDRGETWFQLASTKDNLDFNNIARIVVHPDNPDILLAATTSGRYKLDFANRSGIYKSSNGGNSWTEAYSEKSIGSLDRVKKVLQIIDTPGNFNILYAAIDEKGILKSTNAGDSWFSCSDGITDSSGRFELAISPTSPNKIYAAAEGSPSSNLYVSTNAGINWIKTTENGAEPNWLASQGWYDNTIVVHPFDENIVFVGGVTLYQIQLLADNKRKTTNLVTGPVHVDHHNLLIIPGSGTDFRILNANDGGVGVSSNKSSDWRQPISGLNTTQFYGVDKKPGASAYVGGMQDNGTWRSPENPDASSNWFFQIGGDGYETSWHFDDPDKIIGGFQFNGIMRSLNGGQSYSLARNGLIDFNSGNAPFITKIAKTNSEPDLLFTVGRSGVWKSTNFGSSWSLTSIPSSNWGSITSFHDIKISRANRNIIWAGARMDQSGKIHISTDKGTSFTAAANYDVTTMGGISGLSTHPKSDSTAYVLFSFARKPKILRTTNLGKSWEDISGFGSGFVSTNGFPDVAVYDLLVLPHTPDTIWAGTEIGLFESTDGGESWHIADNGLPNVCIWAMTHVEDEVVLATHGRGIWSVKIPGMADAETYKPLIKNLAQGTDGNLSININLRSKYDSTIVKINGSHFQKINTNAAALQDTTIKYPVTSQQNLQVQLNSYKDGEEYSSAIKNTTVHVFAVPQNSFSNNFNNTFNDYIANGPTVRSYAGFTDGAVHFPHPYTDGQNYTFTLTIPLIVSGTNSVMSYDEVVLVEPGEAGSVYGDEDFWDYVVAEGSKDGLNWISFADGYDSRLHPEWLSSYNLNQNGSSSLFKKNIVDLRKKFSAGDHILIRFRLYSDAAVTGWGWVIDNLEIQENLVSADNEKTLPGTYLLYQNYPNPFNPVTTIKYQVREKSFVTLKIYDAIGKEIAFLVNEEKSAGSFEIKFDAAGKNLSSGVYYYRINAAPAGKAGGFTDTKKFVLLK